MSNNNSLAVVTDADRFAGWVHIYDPSMRELYSWRMPQSMGTPISLDFAPDNRRFASGMIAARDGQLNCSVYFMSLDSDTEGLLYTADAGSMLLRLDWQSENRVMAVFDTYIAVIDPRTAAEVARYDYGGAALQSVAPGRRQTALLLNVHGGNSLVTLSESLTVMSEIPARQAFAVSATDTDIYLLCPDAVECYGYDGVQNWVQDNFSARPIQVLKASELLVFTGSNVAEGWAEELARRGYYRDFRWRSRGRAQQSALYCTVQPATAEMIAGYEKELDLLRDRMVRAERTCNEEAALIERLRSDLSLSRSHAKNLEKTLNEVTSSTFWKLTWPMRYAVSKSRQIWHTFPLFVLLGELRRDGISGVREHARARREYAALFPGNLLRADRFAPVELLVRQANDQPAGPKISIVVPLYNTPLDFLDEMLDSVVNQTYKNWELCCVDAGKDEAVGQHVQARAKADARIRYQKLEKNELIPGNTNKGFEMATGEYIALLDHDDLLHPCALWYAARAIAEQKADFVYTDEATFEGKPEHVVLYHFKPDFMLDNLRSNNYICHLTVFSRALMERAGGGERMEYNGSQDYELFLRLTEQAEKIVHIPHALYYWRSSPGSTAADISAKTYCIDAGIAALKAHYAAAGSLWTMLPSSPALRAITRPITPSSTRAG